MADIRSSQILAQVEWFPDYPYEGSITIELVPEAATAIEPVYTGDITLSLVPEAVIIGNFIYTGDVSLTLVPSVTATLEYSYVGDLSLLLSPGAEYSAVKEYPVEASGGLDFEGEGTVAFSTPSTYTVEAVGGLVVEGSGVEVFVLPSVYTVIAEGGLRISGDGDLTFVESTLYIAVGSGGYVSSGQGSFVFVNILPVFTLRGLGGYRLSGRGTTTFEDPEVTEYVVVGSGGYALSGEGNSVYVTPSKIFSLVGTGEFLFSGAGRIAWFDPDYFSVVGSGGVVISGEGTDEEFVYFTWVFSGVDYKPSVYSGYDFNSYCSFDGKTYGANEEGIFELSGETDDGVDIHTGFVLGPHNLGVRNKKRLRSIHLGNKNLAAKVRVTLDDTSKDFLATKGKVKVTRDLMGEDVTLEVVDFKELSVIEVTPVVLGLRG